MNFISGYSRIHQGRLITPKETTVFAAADFHDFLEKAYDQLALAYPKFYKMDPLSRLGVLASEILLRETPVSNYLPDEVAVVLSNAEASLDTDLRYQATIATAPSPSLFVYTLANVSMGEICIRHGLKGENAFFVSPSFDPQWMSRYVDLIMMQDQVKACVAGWLNVLSDRYDVFLYLVEKQKRGLSEIHSAETLARLYQ
ncbi:hypothetical protein [Pseudochryseolinea flava]|uniref:3-oxoacyl-ACP synthase n=1 Tax=Pseudochryseolinea flava TaxID=2059302 RepID=A0A364Y2Z7_9BACT|nr:hypothetical protein [Pseudochryseolinea flava]RAW00146.1 hypothetical protein DQQ10_16490 [Pseudochryseolinea flava]